MEKTSRKGYLLTEKNVVEVATQRGARKNVDEIVVSTTDGLERTNVRDKIVVSIMDGLERTNVRGEIVKLHVDHFL